MKEYIVNSYFCTRPRLAVRLMECGFEGRKVPNPYNPSYAAWEFDNTPEVREIVATFYAEVNQSRGERHDG